jgi:hypothetical protein
MSLLEEDQLELEKREMLSPLILITGPLPKKMV